MAKNKIVTPTQNIKVFTYNDQEIEFDLTPKALMINATEMAKIFDKDLHQFTKSDHARAFINSFLKPANAGFYGINKEEDLIISKQKSGTWMHRVLALKFAAWLDSDFEVWVYQTIDTILFNPELRRKSSVDYARLQKLKNLQLKINAEIALCQRHINNYIKENLAPEFPFPKS